MNENLDILYEARRGDEVAYLYHKFDEHPPFDITFIPDDENEDVDEDEPNQLSFRLETLLCRFLRNFRPPLGLPRYLTASDHFVESVDEKEGIAFKQLYKFDP